MTRREPVRLPILSAVGVLVLLITPWSMRAVYGRLIARSSTPSRCDAKLNKLTDLSITNEPFDVAASNIHAVTSKGSSFRKQLTGLLNRMQILFDLCTIWLKERRHVQCLPKMLDIFPCINKTRAVCGNLEEGSARHAEVD